MKAMKWFVLPLLVVTLLVAPVHAQPAAQCQTWYGSWNGSQYAIVKGGANPTDSALGADYVELGPYCEECSSVTILLDRWDTDGQYRANDLNVYMYPWELFSHTAEFGQIIYLKATSYKPFELSVCVEADDEVPGPDTEPTVIVPTATPEPTEPPTATPEPTEPSATPTATTEPSATPTATTEPSATPTTTTAASATPTATMEPTAPATATAIATVPPAMVQLLPLIISQAGDLVDSAAPGGERFELTMMGGAIALGFGLLRFLRVMVG